MAIKLGSRFVWVAISSQQKFSISHKFMYTSNCLFIDWSRSNATETLANWFLRNNNTIFLHSIRKWWRFSSINFQIYKKKSHSKSNTTPNNYEKSLYFTINVFYSTLPRQYSTLGREMCTQNPRHTFIRVSESLYVYGCALPHAHTNTVRHTDTLIQLTFTCTERNSFFILVDMR